MTGQGPLLGRPRVAFQPVISTQTWALSHYEALARPVSHAAPPAEQSIEALIAETEKIGEIDRHDAQTIILLQDGDHRTDAVPTRPVSVNVSAVFLSSPFFMQWVLPRIHDLKRRLFLEITERCGHDIRELRPTIRSLKAKGIHVALDDMGAGLHQEPELIPELMPSAIKLDGKLLVSALMEGSTRSIRLVRDYIQTAQAHGVEIIGENIETRAMLDWSRDNGVDYAQGYYIGRPQASAEPESVIRQRLIDALVDTA